mmetsp:Transcript_45738/g.99564  ORF Transcript_45738/g.99564 Transcript_45738/m.99564 type:complete len:312 (+) Transcript_45738:690-1625(+)
MFEQRKPSNSCRSAFVRRELKNGLILLGQSREKRISLLSSSLLCKWQKLASSYTHQSLEKYRGLTKAMTLSLRFKKREKEEHPAALVQSFSWLMQHLSSQRVCDESAQGVRVAGTAPIRLKLIQLNAATATAMTAALGAHQGNAAVAAEMPSPKGSKNTVSSVEETKSTAISGCKQRCCLSILTLAPGNSFSSAHACETKKSQRETSTERRQLRLSSSRFALVSAAVNFASRHSRVSSALPNGTARIGWRPLHSSGSFTLRSLRFSLRAMRCARHVAKSSSSCVMRFKCFVRSAAEPAIHGQYWSIAIAIS